MGIQDNSRITSTSTGQYDMLLAISQDSLNAAIANMWDIEGDNLENIVFKNPRLGSINGRIADVKVQVLADGSGRGAVLVRMQFKDGTTQLFDGNDEPFNRDMKGWYICFKADMALNDIHVNIQSDEAKLKDSNKYTAEELKAAKERLEANYKTIEAFGGEKRAQDYSIQRLFIDFTKADISSYFPSESSFPGLKDTIEINGFTQLLQRWLAGNKKADKSTLGYGLGVPKKDVQEDMKVASVLIPTSLNFNTYGYRAKPGDPVPMGWSGDADRNTLVYCNMTEKREVPGERLLQWSGNFTSAYIADKATRTDGSMILRRGLFLDKFIIPILKQYNDDMQIVPDSIDFDRQGDAGDRQYHWRWKSTLGYNPAHSDWQNDSYFNFTENGMNKNFADTYQKSSKYAWAKQQGFDAVESTEGVSWSWEKTEEKRPADRNEDWHFPKDPVNWVDHLGGSHVSMSHVDVIPVPGSNTIKIRGISIDSVDVNGYYTRLFKDNLDYWGHMKVHVFWQLDIAIYAENGVFVCKFENTKSWVDSTIEASGDLPEDSRGGNWINDMKNAIPKMLKEKESIVDAINDSLNATGKFTHPATGSFLFQAPMFNNRGDLLASCRYNAPKKKDRLQTFDLPERGQEVEQPKADPKDQVDISGDATAPIGKKGK